VAQVHMGPGPIMAAGGRAIIAPFIRPDRGTRDAIAHDVVVTGEGLGRGSPAAAPVRSLGVGRGLRPRRQLRVLVAPEHRPP